MELAKSVIGRFRNGPSSIPPRGLDCSGRLASMSEIVTSGFWTQVLGQDDSCSSSWCKSRNASRRLVAFLSTAVFHLVRTQLLVSQFVGQVNSCPGGAFQSTVSR